MRPLCSLLCLGLWLLVMPLYAIEMSSSAMTLIPLGLSEAETKVYRILIDLLGKRQEKQHQGPRPVVVFTDVGKDYDDVAALVILSEFHRLGFVELRAMVANLMPAEKRARFARAVLDSLNLVDVPVACGTRGSTEYHEELKHELEFNEVESWWRSKPLAPKDVPLLDGRDLLLQVYRKAKENGEKLYLLCLSSLQDAYEFASGEHGSLVVKHTAEVHMQGGNFLSLERKFEPDCNAANNRFNLDAATGWHSFLQMHDIPSRTYAKGAAFSAPLTSEVFVQLERTGHPIGAYLRRVQVEQDVAFYQRACEIEPEKRFAPYMDQMWFLVNKTNWPEGDALPIGEEIIPYLTKVVLYDVHPALGVAGEDVVRMLVVPDGEDVVGTFEVDRTIEHGERVPHWITVNELRPPASEKLSLAVLSLLKGGLSFHMKREDR